MVLLLFLILAVIIAVVFANMALYVVGGILGIMIVVFIYIIKRRLQK